MKISLIGLGMLGSEVYELMKASGHEVRAFNFPDFDIRKQADLAAACKGADAILNCAAYTAVDKAEAEKDLCYAINAAPLAILGAEAKKAKAFVVHISTDFVFDGSGDNAWSETDKPAPINVYGASKLEGERLLFASGCKGAVMRVQWTYGKHGVNMVSKLLDAAKTRKTIKVVDDQAGAPTHAADMAKEIKALAEKRIEGLFHFAAAGYCSRLECAKMIFKTLGMDDIEVVPCKTSEYKSPAQRPLNSRFNCDKIDKATGIKRPTWDAAMKKYLLSL